MTAGVSSSDADNLAPVSLTLPLMTDALWASTTVPQGYIAISGLKIVFFDGSAWKTVTSA